jgi:hypothetical protein
MTRSVAWVRLRSVADLKEGDIVRGVVHDTLPGGEPYIITANYGAHAVAVRTLEVTNPIEWEVLRKLDGDQR